MSNNNRFTGLPEFPNFEEELTKSFSSLYKRNPLIDAGTAKSLGIDKMWENLAADMANPCKELIRTSGTFTARNILGIDDATWFSTIMQQHPIDVSTMLGSFAFESDALKNAFTAALGDVSVESLYTDQLQDAMGRIVETYDLYDLGEADIEEFINEHPDEAESLARDARDVTVAATGINFKSWNKLSIEERMRFYIEVQGYVFDMAHTMATSPGGYWTASKLAVLSVSLTFIICFLFIASENAKKGDS